MYTIAAEFDNYRILCERDDDYDIEDLKGDSYDPIVNSDIDPEKLRREEIAFERAVKRYGVYFLVLEVWNPAIGKGWELVDSCGGVVGKSGIKDTIAEFKQQVL